MAPVRSSPEGSRTASPAWFVAPAVAISGIAVLIEVFLVPAAARWAVGVFGAVIVLVVAAVVWRGRDQADLVAELRRRVSEQDRETGRLADVVLPAAMERLKQGETVEEILDGLAARGELDPALHSAHLAMLGSVLEAVKAEEDLRESAQRAFVNIARRVQAIVHQKFQDLREMEDRHGRDSEVFADLLKLDHGTALIGRLADSIAVLGGSRPGRQWQKNVPLYSVLRGAVSRITDYRRVDVHSVLEVAVVGPAVEPLIHALAELLDNATRYSPPHTRVHLTAVEVQSGVAVEIEDGGVGLSEEARIRAERVLSQVSAGLDLADLGQTPRLGLPVVGRLAQANGFQVALRPSAYAGVRAVLVIPHELLSMASAPATPIPGAGVVGADDPTEVIAVPEARAGEPEPVINGAGLPQRRRRAPIATTTGPTAPKPTQTPTPNPNPNPNPTSTPTAAGEGVTAAPFAPDGSTTASPTASAQTPSKQSSAPVQPGLWLAAFQNSVSEEFSGSARPAGDDPSTKEGGPA